jgi:chromosome partitioning protein
LSLEESPSDNGKGRREPTMALAVMNQTVTPATSGHNVDAGDTFVTASQIAGMASPPVTEQTVANWQRRFADFPKPEQPPPNQPVWRSSAVRQWLINTQNERAPKVISFINLKGGVAKTTTSVAVAEMLSDIHGKCVLFIDLDPQTNASINLFGEQKWKECNDSGRTLAQLFRDKLQPDQGPLFSIENAIAKGVSTINGGISKLHLLPSSIEFIEIQEKLPFVAAQGNYETNPIEILHRALLPVIDRYDYVIIDCPPSLGVVTKNGLRFSTHYVIPAIPDILSTWGIFQIVDSINRFERAVNHAIKPLGIIATKVRSINLHRSMIDDLKNGRLFSGKGVEQPSLFEAQIKENAATAAGADADLELDTFKKKYDANTDAFESLAKEIIQRCQQ